ncbi:MAG: polyprenol monophosphomannose synthase [Solirubrobacterales bacterium]|nr:polyprenol monophosphomannose synthase [Solirubrobacterales bacterium]
MAALDRDPEAVATWLVLPTYDEAENLERIVASIRAVLPAGVGILVVDDASPDGTGEIAVRLATTDPAIRLLQRHAKLGLGPAYVAGFWRVLEEGAEVVCQLDADGSHDPAELPDLIAALADADLVIGSRYVAGGRIEDWGALRRGVSRLGGIYASRLLGMGVRDPTSGFRAYRREALEAIGLDAVEAKGYAFQVEMTHRALRHGMRVVELPIVFRDRSRGRSKMTPRIALEAAWRIPAMRLARRSGRPRRADGAGGR